LATTDETHYYAAVSGSGPNTYVNPTTSTYYVGGSPPAGFTLIGAQPPAVESDNDYWQYLGQEEFFVAAKIAIFEESYVKNTINVGTKNGTGAFANIVIAGGRTDPYIAIGQNATVGTTGAAGTTLNPGGTVIGYDRPGIFLGIYEQGAAGTTGRFSIKSTGGDRYVKWDGTDLSLSGKLNAGGMELGTGVNSSAGNGLYLNANNYWYDTGTSFKVGGASNYLEWDGTTLTLRGSLKQTNSGTPEGSFRGNWAAGVAYYEDDTVFYADGSYICGVAHTSTNDTNVNTGYPPNAINSWSVYAAAGTSGTAGSSGTAGTGGTSGLNGAAGTTGPGVVYRGVFNAGNVYYHTTERRDITKVGSSFYLTNNLSLNNSSGSVWGSPPNANWSSFGAQFTSVATDVLLAQDATITRGLVMGTEGSDTGFIRSANASSLLGGTGFYLDVNGRMRIGQAVSGSTNKYLYWDGSELDINGTINADAGNIGGFIIEDNKLLASGSLLRFDTQIPQIEFYTNATGSAKVVLNPNPNLTSPSGGTLYISGAQYYGTEGNRTAVTGTTAFTAYVTETYSGSLGVSTVYSSEPFTVTAFTEGGNTNFSVYIPQTSLTISGTTPSAYSSYPPYSPSYEYESYYSEYAQPGSAQVQWYLQMFDSTGTTFISEVSINGASTYRTTSATNGYYQATGMYPGPYYWSSTSYTSPAYYQGDILEGTKTGQIVIPSSGVFTFRLVLRVSANASAVYDYDTGIDTYYTLTATSNHTRTSIQPWVYNTTTLGGAFEFSPNLNKTEITNGGIQVISNKDAYIQMYRIEPSAYGSSETLMRAVGAKSVFSAFGTYPANLDEIGIQVNGEIQSFGNYNKFGDTLFTGTGQYNIVDIGGRYTGTLADQSYVSTYSNIRPSYDDRYDLGAASSYRWRDIFTNGAVTTTSDRTKKTNITESILGLDFINRLKPVSYNMISGSAILESVEDYIPILSEPAITGSYGEILKEAVYTYEKNTVPPRLLGYEMGKRTHYGLIAQDVKDTLDEIGLTTTDFAGYVAADKDAHTELGLRYDEFISPIIKAIQELSQKVIRLENEISGSLGL
jgi:hypothetical protein